MQRSNRREVVVVGAGVNGLTCAALLARAGFRVVVLEAADTPGGLARTVEFAPGYRGSLAAHLMPAPAPRLVRRLALERFGWSAGPPVRSLALVSGEAPVALDLPGDDSRFPDADREGWRTFAERTAGLAGVLRSRLEAAPLPLKATTPREAWQLIRTGLALATAGRRRVRELLRVIGMPVADYVAEFVGEPRLAGALCAEALWGSSAGPRSPGTLFGLLHRRALGDDDRWLQPAGGPAAYAAALAASAVDAGAEIHCGTPVQRILVECGKVTGVETADGRIIRSLTVISAVDPAATLLRLVGPRALETGLVRDARRIRGRGGACRVLLGLDGPPTFAGGMPDQPFRAIVAGTPDEMETAADARKYGRSSPSPVLELTLHGIGDETAAPAGHHIVSVTAQYAPFVDDPVARESLRADLVDAVIARLDEYLPGCRERVVASACYTPADLADANGSTGGHWHHAELTLDQFFFTRPAASIPAYRVPVEGLFLASAGTHPGGGLTGWSGRLAAAEVQRG